MADIKISQLPSLVGTVQSTDLIPVVQGGVTYKATQSQLPSSPPPSSAFKVYTALLTFNGGNILVTQLQNTIGDGSNDGVNDIAWTNPSNGVILGIMSSGTPFTPNKTFFINTTFDNGGELYFVTGARWFVQQNNRVQFVLTRYDNTRTGTPNFANLPIEIRVYN